MLVEKIYSEGSEFSKEEVTGIVEALNQKLKDGEITNWRVYGNHDYDGTEVVFETAREETEEEKAKRTAQTTRNEAAQNENMTRVLRERGFEIKEPEPGPETDQEKAEREFNAVFKKGGFDGSR